MNSLGNYTSLPRSAEKDYLFTVQSVYKNQTLYVKQTSVKIGFKEDGRMEMSIENGTFEKECCRYVAILIVSLFKSKLLAFIYIENLFIFYFH